MWTGFRIRSRQRDHRTDVLRLARLVGALDEVETSLVRERKGLQKRYERMIAGGAGAQQQGEDGGCDADPEPGEATLSAPLEAYVRRMQKLKRQLSLIEQMRATMEDFVEDEGLGHQPASPLSHARH